MSRARQVTLLRWAEENFDPPPALRTLRKWARQGCIYPEPQLVGREYRVSEDAEYVPPAGSRRPAKAVLSSKDPVVNDIFYGGKTQKRRQA